MQEHRLGHLLIVDDELELTTALCEMLNKHGYQAVGFTSGQAALKSLRENEFDILLTDMMMPEMDGIALMRAALQVDQNLVAFMMTGQGTVQTAVEAMKVGAFDYVLKPFNLQAMLPILNRGLEVRRLTGGDWNPLHWHWREMLTVAQIAGHLPAHPASNTY